MNMRHSPILTAVLLTGALLLSIGCSAAAPTLQRSSDIAPASAPAAPSANNSGVAASGKSSELASAPSQSTDRMVIRTAYMQLVVADVGDVIDKAAKLAQDMGGYVVSSENQLQGTERIGKASIRVPSQRMDEALKAIRGLAIRTGRESSSSKDVSEEYVDQDARLRALRVTESSYLELMKGARTTNDIITIQQSLTQIRQQIEQAQGRIQYLQRSTEMAVINLDIMTAGAAKPITSGEWNAQDVASTALQALIGVGTVLAGAAIWVVVFVPVWGPAALIIRWWMRRRQSPSGPPPQPVGDTV